MRFTDFLIFDAAAQSVFTDIAGQRVFRLCLARLAETVRQNPGMFMSEATASRKGVAFKQKSLDDLEHGVFAQRLADRLHTKPKQGAYGDFLRHSVLQQGQVLGDMNWDTWEVTQKTLELGGVDPNIVTSPNTTPAERMALVGRINWANISLPALKARLGPSFRAPDHWKRQFCIEKLKRIKAAVENGQAITDPNEQRLLGIWRTLRSPACRRGRSAEPDSSGWFHERCRADQHADELG